MNSKKNLTITLIFITSIVIFGCTAQKNKEQLPESSSANNSTTTQFSTNQGATVQNSNEIPYEDKATPSESITTTNNIPQPPIPSGNENVDTNSNLTQNEYETNNPVSSSSLKLTDYIVKKGDILYSICKSYETHCPVPIAVKTILNLNGLTEADGLKENMTLKIPADYLTHGNKYTIKKGDTLFSIARNYLPSDDPQQAVDKIIKNNFITSEEINEGDELFISTESIQY